MNREPAITAGAAREVNIGERLRDLRSRLGLSVRALAAQTDFSPSFISQVELGQVSPSIASLERIVGALGVSLGELFSEATPGPTAVIRGADRRRLTSSWSRAQVESLAPVGAGSKMEPIMLVLAPGGYSGKHAQTRTGEEFAIVFAGEVTLTLGAEVHVLRPGDAVTFRSDTPHTWENTGPEPARIVIVSSR